MGVSGILVKLRGLLHRVSSGHHIRAEHLNMLDSLEWKQPFLLRDFTVVDCEMTGLNPKKDEILSIGAVRVCGGRILLKEKFYKVFKPYEAVSPEEIMLIHGLGREDMNEGGRIEDSLAEFLEFIQDSVLVGHFVTVDLDFLNATLQAHRLPSLANPAIDTRSLYHWWREWKHRIPQGMTANEQLTHIAQELGLPRYPAHNAYYDALTTAYLFLKLAHDFENAGNVQFRALFKQAGVY